MSKPTSRSSSEAVARKQILRLSWDLWDDGSVLLLGPRSLYDTREVYGEFWCDNGRWHICCADDPALIEATSGARGDAASGRECLTRIERAVRRRYPGVRIAGATYVREQL